MAESAVKRESLDELTRNRVLRPVDDEHVRLAKFRAQVRAAGESLAADRPGEFTACLACAAADGPVLANLELTDGHLVEDFIEGLNRRSDTVTDDTVTVDLAAHLISGRAVRSEVEKRLATAYVVAVVRRPDTLAEWEVPSIRHALPDGALMTECDMGLAVLIPDGKEPSATTTLQELPGHFQEPVWVGMAQRPRAHIADAFQEAAEIAQLAAAGRQTHKN